MNNTAEYSCTPIMTWLLHVGLSHCLQESHFSILSPLQPTLPLTAKRIFWKCKSGAITPSFKISEWIPVVLQKKTHSMSNKALCITLLFISDTPPRSPPSRPTALPHILSILPSLPWIACCCHLSVASTWPSSWREAIDAPLGEVGPNPNPSSTLFFLTVFTFFFTQFTEFDMPCLFHCLSLTFLCAQPVLFTAVFIKSRTAVLTVDRMKVGSVGVNWGTLVFNFSFCFYSSSGLTLGTMRHIPLCFYNKLFSPFEPIQVGSVPYNSTIWWITIFSTSWSLVSFQNCRCWA